MRYSLFKLLKELDNLFGGTGPSVINFLQVAKEFLIEIEQRSSVYSSFLLECSLVFPPNMYIMPFTTVLPMLSRGPRDVP